jgi:ubiquinone/menaquinone biosynthesis C-methylase UbiE
MHIDFGKSNKILDFAFELLVPLVAKLFYRDALPYNYLIESKRTFSAPDELIEIFCDNGSYSKKDMIFCLV